ncbi:hypothetical protein [Lysinibacillus xylanilyticus]|uniref:hypothetical protein n=1 Tax=Lysinibacillus xylanilyticus TaxID=582475 RepID=UPI003D03ED45
MRYTRFYFGLVLFLLIAGAFFFYLINDTYVEAVYQIGEENLVEENGDYYLILDNRKLTLPERLYNEIKWEKNDEYHVGYEYKIFSKNNGDVVMLKKYGYSP